MNLRQLDIELLGEADNIFAIFASPKEHLKVLNLNLYASEEVAEKVMEVVAQGTKCVGKLGLIFGKTLRVSSFDRTVLRYRLSQF